VRICTILLVGGTPASETIADSASDRWQGRLDALLSESGAEFASLADGSLLVTFDGDGVPTDRAARAAHCALALAAHLPDAPLVVATGGLQVDGGAEEGPGLGAVIDRAVEALRATSPGSVRVDATTAGLLDARFAFSESLPGEHGERLLLGEIEPLSRARLVRGRPAPFVGREREFLLLETWQRESVRTRRARLVRVHAPAGEGKSRLRDELLARFVTNQPETLVISGSCPERAEHGGGLRDALEHAIGVTPADETLERQQKLNTWLSQRLSPATAERSLLFLGEVLGVPFPDAASAVLRAARHAPEEMAESVARAVIDALSACLAGGPVVLALERVVTTKCMLQHGLE
jgi:hypothetical protein